MELNQDQKLKIIEYYVNQRKTLTETAKFTKLSSKTIRIFLKNQNINIRNAQDYLKTPISSIDEKNIINDYVVNKLPINQITKGYRIRQNRFYDILNKYGHKTRKSNDLNTKWLSQEQLNKAIEIYNRFGKIKTISKFLNVSSDSVVRSLKRAGIEVKTSRKDTATFFEIWSFLYGEDKAKQLQKNYLEKCSKLSSGKNNPMYGKPSPNGSGCGWKGYYNGFYFRSLRELSYLLYLDDNQIKWETAERKKFTIKYKNYDGTERTYRPDFLINENKLVEIKPKRLHNSPLIKLKTEAAQQFCKLNELIFEIIDFSINAERIKLALDNKQIKFDRDYEKRFLDYTSKNEEGFCICQKDNQ